MTVVSNINVETYTDKIPNSWDEYVKIHSESSICHLSAWKCIIEKSFGHKCIYILASKDNHVVGVLPLVYMKSRLFGSFLFSFPSLN